MRKIFNLKYLSALLLIPACVYIPDLFIKANHATFSDWQHATMPLIMYVGLFLLAIFYWGADVLKPDWHIWKQNWIRHTLVALVTAIILLLVIMPLAKVVGGKISAPFASAILTRYVPTILVFIAPLLQAFTEEIVYHHVLTQPFENNKFQYVIASIGSNLIFTFVHINNVDWKISSLFMYFVMGVCFQLIYLLSKRNIWQNIITHLIYNAFIAIPGMIMVTYVFFNK